MDQAVQFLDHLFQYKPDEMFILLWTLPNRHSRWFRDPVAAADYAGQIGSSQDTYVGVYLSDTDRGGSERGRADQSAGVVALWAEIDVASDGRHPSSVDDALAFATSLPLPPSLIVSSGHGLHLWWCLKEPWLFDDPMERQKAGDLERAWHRTIACHAERHGWRLDAVHDLSRVLRVPGTINHKDPDHPVPVVLLQTSDARYDPSDFYEYLTTTSVATVASESIDEVRDLAQSLVIDADAVLPTVAEGLQGKEWWEKTWNHERPDFRDQSLSVYDMSLTHQLVIAGANAQEITDTLIVHRQKWAETREKEKLRADYYARTIIKGFQRSKGGGQANGNGLGLLRGRESNGRVDAADRGDDEAVREDRAGVQSSGDESARQQIERLEEACDGETEDDADDDRIADIRTGSDLADLSWLSDAFGFIVQRVVRYHTDPDDDYALHIGEKGDQVVHVGTANNLHNQDLFRQKMSDVGKLALRTFDKATWGVIATVLVDACEDDTVGAEATYAGRALAWLAHYFGRVGTAVVRSDEAYTSTNEQPFLKDGYYYVFGTDLHKHVTVTMGEKLAGKEMGLCLRALGCTPDVVHMRSGERGKEKRSTRSVWKVKADLITVPDEEDVPF